ncbi:stalk domain-containing protein [Paenibacillus elgii]|uniref:stalk domain-containing protein n=1 Tax=Paenibacillus elgii TaxID=189691 RepID=UPI00203EECA1|nr:stalk domain-containing protein [Paenibacillus elgii]MCM3271060.1 copper amine oxidase N-terminal domain-containing protein [Paenibacillus elgii]
MRRRAILVIILSCLLVAIGFTDESVNAATDHDNDNRYINTFLNGEALILDPTPVIINKEVLVPARQLFERLGYKVEWNESDETIHAERGLSRIDLRINGGVGDANGMQYFTSVNRWCFIHTS